MSRRRGRFEAGQLHVAEQVVVVAKPREGDGEALVHGGVGAPLGDTVAVRVVGERLPNLGPVILTVGSLAVREPLRALAPELRPPPGQVASRPHGGGIDGGLREPAAAEHHGNRLRVDRIGFGLAARDGFHVERVAEHEGEALAGTPSREPGPREDALDGQGHLVTRGGTGLEQGGWMGVHVPRHDALTMVVQDADVHGAGMPVEAPIKLARRGVEAPEIL
jgi:hypothetical protein